MMRRVKTYGNNIGRDVDASYSIVLALDDDGFFPY